ncbi:MAG: DUF2066 domain-containing protein [Gammaproteobacteria bacterium]
MPVLLLVFCLLWPALAGAQTPATAQAYEARVPVADQSAPERETAVREALRQVVTRVSGEDAIYQAASLIEEAPQLMQRYGYERDPDGSLHLVAGFDNRAVDARLKALGLPVWGVYAADVEDVQMEVSGIDSAAAYVRLLSSLQALPSVRGVKPLRAAGDRLELRVRSEGGAGRLSGALLAAGFLVSDPAGRAELSYRMVRTPQ